MASFSSDRTFTVFDFNVSHSQLLLRSQKSEGNQNNIDIIFFGVSFLHIPSSIWGISIEDVTNNSTKLNELGNCLDQTGFPASKVFAIKTKNVQYYIIGGFFKVYQNQLEFHETSLGVLEYRGREIEIASNDNSAE